MSTTGHLKCYRSLGELLDDDLARRDKKSSEDLLMALGVSEKTLNRWRAGKRPSSANLQNLARTTLLPLELLLRVAHGIPTYANLHSRRMAYSDWELEFVSQDVVRNRLFEVERPRSIQIDGVQPGRDLELVLKSRPQVYREGRRPPQEIFQSAIELAPSLNLIAHGPNPDGTRIEKKPVKAYSGHVLTLPLGEEAHTKLRTMKAEGLLLHEGDLTSNDLVSLDSPDLRALHVYSFFAFTPQIAYVLLQALVGAILWHRDSLVSNGCFLSQYVVTHDGDHLGKVLGLGRGVPDHGEWNREDTEIQPRYREAAIHDLSWLLAYPPSI